MNKSIAKTRNQLQRITYKINQLKTKYTGETCSPLTFTNCQNSPRQPSYSDVRNRQKDRDQSKQQMNFGYSGGSYSVNLGQAGKGIALRDVPHVKDTSNGRDISKGRAGQQTYQKQFRVFRNQIYNYVDKCLIMAKQREQQLIQKSQEQQRQMEPRIQKLQQQTTTILTSIHELQVQLKKQQKLLTQKQNTMQIKLRKEIKQLREKIQEQINIAQNLKSNVNANEDADQQVDITMERIEEKIQAIILRKQDSILEAVQKKITDFTKSFNKSGGDKSKELDMEIVRVNKIVQEVKKQVTEIDKQYVQQKANSVEQFSKMISLELNRVEGDINTKIKNLEEKVIKSEQLKLIQQCDRKIAELFNSISVIKDNVKIQLTTTQQTLQNRVKTIQSSVVQLPQTLSSLSKNSVPDLIPLLLPELLQQLHQKLQSNYTKPRLEQIKRELTTKQGQQFQFMKQDLLINIQQQVFEKINKFVTQQRSRKSPSHGAAHEGEQIKNYVKTEIKDMEIAIKGNILGVVEEAVNKLIAKQRVDTLQTSFNISHRNNTLNDETMDLKRTQQLIDSKLNQFENDINETIKLLYQDIQNRVNEMLSHSGMKQLKQQLQNLKKEYKDTQTKVKSLTLLAISQPRLISNTQSNTSNMPETDTQSLHQLQTINQNIGQHMQKFRGEVYNDMGAQIDKLSHILERAVEQMQTKIEKLDNNFSYVYERMSKVEYDNANFKDQLTGVLSSQKNNKLGTPTLTINNTSPLLPKSASRDNLAKGNTVVKSNASIGNPGNYLLDALGQYHAGGYFFQSG